MVYGWLSNPFVEYYIIEAYDGSGYTPLSAPSTISLGTVYAEGSIYDLGYTYRVGVPNSPGVSSMEPIMTLYSVRRQRRLSGKVDVGARLAAWRSSGIGGSAASQSQWQVLGCLAQGMSVYGKCIPEIIGRTV